MKMSAFLQLSTKGFGKDGGLEFNQVILYAVFAVIHPPWNADLGEVGQYESVLVFLVRGM